MRINGKKITRAFMLAGAAAGLALAELELHPTQFGANVDFGHAVKSNEKSSITDMHPITRTGVYLTASGTYNKKFDVILTTGGLFWYALPDRNPWDTRIMFGPGVGQAQGLYKFGDPENPAARLQFGLFSHKYNPDSKNLGEYLYRSGTYPGYIWTGGWSYVNSAAYLAQGLRFTLPTFGGIITHDITVYMERDYAPSHDLSPGYILTVKPSVFFEFGAGIVWANGIHFKPDSILTPRELENAYDENGIPLSPQDVNNVRPHYEYYGPSNQVWMDTAGCAGACILNPSLYYAPYRGDLRNDSLVVPDSVFNQGVGVMVANPLIGTLNAEGDKHYVSAGPTGNDPANYSYMDRSNGTPRNKMKYYSFQGFKGMARMSLDVGTLLGMEENSFKFYGEAALLGFKDYPFYYAKKSERMPLMFGINIPTFGLLDMLTFEVEYLNSPFENSIENAYDQLLPVPGGGEPRVAGWKTEFLDSAVEKCSIDGCPLTRADFDMLYDAQTLKLQEDAKKDNWKWSVYARRKIMEGVTITAQAACDHLRHLDIVYAKPSGVPATTKPSEWYYVFRLEFGI